MHRRHSQALIWSAVVALLFVLAALFTRDIPYAEMFERIEGSPVLVGAVYTLAMFIATVVAPIAALPLVPLAAGILDPFIVAVLSIAGWTAGAVVAFVIARRFGRPFVLRFVDEAKLGWYERMVPERGEFLTIVVLRMMVPVDILSYALGIATKRLTMGRYTLATLIGITPFSFIFAYGGAAIWAGEYKVLVGIAAAGLILYFFLHYVFRRMNRNTSE